MHALRLALVLLAALNAAASAAAATAAANTGDNNDGDGVCTSSCGAAEPHALPSRARLSEGQAVMVPRVDPVLWGGRRDGPLSPAQLEEFEERGFVVLPGLFGEDEAADALAAAWRLAENPPEGALLVKEPDDESAVKSVFRPHMLDETLRSVLLSDRVVRVAEQILDDTVHVFQSRVNFQRAIVGRGFNWHSDFETWHTEDGMPRMRAVSVVIMLEPNAAYNGALMVMPGSHRVFAGVGGKTPEKNWESSLRHQAVGSPTFEQLREMASRSGIQHCEGAAGSVIVFDSNLMHGSHTNMSPFGRTNAFTVFNADRNRLREPYGGSSPRPDHLASRGVVDTWTSAADRR